MQDCITCRKRHKKCDEKLPRCGSCVISDRTCIWPNSRPESSEAAVQTPSIQRKDRSTYSEVNSLDHLQPTTPQDAFSSSDFTQPSAYSPANTVTSDFLTADLASVRWLDLLATDAIQANKGFSRAPSPSGEGAPRRLTGTAGLPCLPSTEDQTLPNPSVHLDGLESRTWQLDHDIVLKDFETAIFRNFVDHAALWLDLFDADKHFSVYSTRLAIRNIGLMKAILALSAQHLSRQGSRASSGVAVDPNLAVEYYYETLHYVQTALQFNSYAHSEELLATALVISTYEMLDESDSGWQRHLKGVFWIQRSQNVDGGSGGIRQAVWWAWLRQDIWAAFRERRRCLSFWKPVKDYSEQNRDELADSSVYLLSQAVNYSADPEEPTGWALQRRIDAADELLARLDRWKSFLSTEFTPLPMSQSSRIFQPIWIHPPKFGVALQVFHFARILIMLHRPAVPGFKSYLKVQKTLSEAVAVICGIAMELNDEGCQIVSAQCLYGAGLCVQEVQKRNEIISLINLCEVRTGWPMSTMRDNLFKEWQKIDSDESGGPEQAMMT